VARLDWLTHDDFPGRVGEPFEVTVDDRPPLTLVLAETSLGTELGGPGPDGQERLQFSLIFTGPASPFLPQGTYELHHAELGELSLFLVPLGPQVDAMRYEAAFA
jgi:hypothetical protein